MSEASPKPRRKVLVTGATSGIGQATSSALLAAGHRVVGVGRDLSKARFDDPAFHGREIDLGDLEALPARLEELGRDHPDLDGLVLNAGRGEIGGLEQLSYVRIRTLIDLDFTSHAFVARAFLPAFKKRGSGDLVFLGSEAALAGSRQGSVYCAAKFALRGFAQALRDECARAGVRVSLVNPGMVRTPFFDPLPIEPGPEDSHALVAEEVAAAVLFILEQRPGAVIDEINLSPLKKLVVRKPRD